MANKSNETIKKTKDKHDKLLSLLENPARKELRKEFNRAYTEAINQYFSIGMVASSVWYKHQDNLFNISKKYFKKSIKAGYLRTGQTFIKAKWISQEDFARYKKSLDSNFEDYIEKQSRDAAKAMTKTSQKFVARIIRKAEEAEQKNEKNAIADNLIALALSEAKEQGIWRSIVSGLAIANTGANEGSIFFAKETEKDKGVVLFKQWLTMNDDLVRDTHQKMEKVIVLVSEKFTVPKLTGGSDQMDQPGDMMASIGNWINCRCTIRYTLKN